MPYSITPPLKSFICNAFRVLARSLFPLLTRTQIAGLYNFSKNGPLILVGNHTGAMDVLLMETYSPITLKFVVVNL